MPQALLNISGIAEAVVLVKEENDTRVLVAYITVPGKEYNTDELRSALSSTLPDHMVPSYFIYLEKIPVTVNGKVDKAALRPGF